MNSKSTTRNTDAELFERRFVLNYLERLKEVFLAANVPSDDMEGENLEDCKRIIQKLDSTAKYASLVSITDFLGSPIIAIYNAAEVTFLDLKVTTDWHRTNESEINNFINNLIEYAYFVHAKLRSLLYTFECTITKYEREELINSLDQDLSQEEVTLSPFKSLLSISEKAVKVYASQLVELLENSLALEVDHKLDNVDFESFINEFLKYFSTEGAYVQLQDFKCLDIVVKRDEVIKQITKFGNANTGTSREKAIALKISQNMTEKELEQRFPINARGIYSSKESMLKKVASQIYHQLH